MNKRIVMFFTLLGITISCALQSMDHTSEITYRKADQSDHAQILHLMQTQAIHDADKLVILPKKFRAAALAETLKQERIFVAVDQSEGVVGYKKLFIPGEQEVVDILTGELRCKGPSAQLVKSGIFVNATFVEKEIDLAALMDQNTTLFVYNGGDFTHPEYRKCGISLQLTDHALSTIIPEINKGKLQQLALIYGITQSNAGQTPGDKQDRTHYILRSFEKYIRTFEQTAKYPPIAHARFTAFKPSFDPNAEECKPLPDTESIPGYGCILMHRLAGERDEQ